MIEGLKQVRDALAAYNTSSTVKHPLIREHGIRALATLDSIITDHIPDATSKMVVPDGYKLVPIECLEYLADKSKFDVTVTSYVDAMLSAAPQPPTGD